MLATFAPAIALAVLSAGPIPPVKIVIETDPTPVRLDQLDLLSTSEPTNTVSHSTIRPSQRKQHDQVLDNLRTGTSLQQARRQIDAGQFADAIQLLEGIVATTGANNEVLETLEDAYRREIGKLMYERKQDEAHVLIDRLRVLTKSETNPVVPRAQIAVIANRPTAQRQPATLAAGSNSAASVATFANATSSNATKSTFKPAYEARAKLDVDANPITQFDETYKQAERLFAEQKYEQALPLYEKAYEIDGVGIQAGRVRWGYCLLFTSYQRYNRYIQQSPPRYNLSDLDKLENDLKLASRLSPSLQPTIKKDRVFERINLHRDRLQQSTIQPIAATAPAPAANSNRYANTSVANVPTRSFRHLPGRSQSWSIIETENFHIYHRNPAMAEEVAQLAEQAREQGFIKWTGSVPNTAWAPRCQIMLYPTTYEFTQATGAPAVTPGQTSIVNDGGRIVSRKIDLRTDDPNMRLAVLPHEVTHAVIADIFVPYTLPRWADEGMAVLTEPRSKQEAHLANLGNLRRSGAHFTCSQMMTMTDYPRNHMQSFYAHSVGLCRYLVERFGAQRLTAFLKASLRTGNYELALQQVYGMSSFAALDAGFENYVAQLQQRPINFASATR